MGEIRAVQITLAKEPKYPRTLMPTGSIQLKVYIPEVGKKDWPVPIYVSEKEATEMEDGGTYLATMEKGEKYWDWKGFATPEEAAGLTQPSPAPQPKAQSAPPAQAERPQYVSERERNESIVRQVAAKAATDIFIHDGGAMSADVDLWDAWFDHISNRILNIPPLVEQALAAGGVVTDTEKDYIPPGPEGEDE